MITPKQITDALESQLAEPAVYLLQRLLAGESTTIAMGMLVCPKCDENAEDVDITIKPDGSGYFCMKCEHEWR